VSGSHWRLEEQASRGSSGADAPAVRPSSPDSVGRTAGEEGQYDEYGEQYDEYEEAEYEEAEGGLHAHPPRAPLGCPGPCSRWRTSAGSPSAARLGGGA
jgi:hypothetical protein